MATTEKRGTDSLKDDGVAETTPVNPVLVSILTQEEAKKFVVDGNFDLGDAKSVFVTEDKNIFTLENKIPAYSHAEKHNLKIFRVDEWSK